MKVYFKRCCSQTCSLCQLFKSMRWLILSFKPFLNLGLSECNSILQEKELMGLLLLLLLLLLFVLCLLPFFLLFLPLLWLCWPGEADDSARSDADTSKSRDGIYWTWFDITRVNTMEGDVRRAFSMVWYAKHIFSVSVFAFAVIW